MVKEQPTLQTRHTTSSYLRTLMIESVSIGVMLRRFADVPCSGFPGNSYKHINIPGNRRITWNIGSDAHRNTRIATTCDAIDRRTNCWTDISELWRRR